MEKIYNFGSKFTNCFCVPQRYLLAIMTGLSIFCSYTMRANMNLAITEMVSKNKTAKESADQCKSGTPQHYFTVTDPDIIYHWSEEIQSHILGSFYWTYIIFHVPGAMLAERIGGKHVLGAALLSNAILTLIQTPLLIMTDGSWVVLVVMRVLIGLGQGAIMPTAATLLGQWTPKREKALLSTICFSGSLVGTAVCNSAGGALIRHFKHWSVVFYLFGGVAVVWCLAWQLVCYSFPSTHPCLKEKERELLDSELKHDVSTAKKITPWKSIILSLPVWALTVLQWGHSWGFFTLNMFLPKYMSAVLKFNVQEVGLVTSLPYIFMWIASLIIGFGADWLIQKNYLSVKMTRRIFGSISNTGPGIFMVLAVYARCNGAWAVTMFTLSLFCMGFYYAGGKANALDLSPNFAGSVTAISNGIGVIPGVLGAFVVGKLVANNTLGEWRLVFWIAFIMLFVTNVFYVFFLSAEIQHWNYPKQPTEEEKDV